MTARTLTVTTLTLMQSIEQLEWELERLYVAIDDATDDQSRGIAEMHWMAAYEQYKAATAEVAADLAYDVWADGETA